MQVRDRHVIQKLMIVKGISARKLAVHAKWSSHTYLQRLLRGEVTTLRPEPAALIAQALGVQVDDLFVTRVTTNQGHDDQERVA